MRPSWIEVDLDVIKKNTEQIRARLKPGTKFLATVKGDGYGHGAVETAKLLSAAGVDYFGVAFAEEGAELREAGIAEPVLIYGRTFSDSYDMLFDSNLIPNIFSLEQARELSGEAERRNTKLLAHISIDTGLHRLGLDWNEQTKDVVEEIFSLPGLEIRGIFSMFSNSRISAEFVKRDTYVTKMQFERFTHLCAELEQSGIHIPMKHICDSAGALLFPDMQLDMVRIGSSLFGTYITDLSIGGLELRPAMSVYSRLASIRHINRGESVGYNCSWTAMQPSVIGVVPFGTVDGMSSTASGKGSVLLHGHRCRIIGEVCMDQMMIDITDIEDPEIGDEVVMIGSQNCAEITAQEAASCAGLEDLELLCKMGKRSPVYYIEHGKKRKSMPGTSEKKQG